MTEIHGFEQLAIELLLGRDPTGSRTHDCLIESPDALTVTPPSHPVLHTVVKTRNSNKKYRNLDQYQHKTYDPHLD